MNALMTATDVGVLHAELLRLREEFLAAAEVYPTLYNEMLLSARPKTESDWADLFENVYDPNSYDGLLFIPGRDGHTCLSYYYDSRGYTTWASLASRGWRLVRDAARALGPAGVVKVAPTKLVGIEAWVGWLYESAAACPARLEHSVHRLGTEEDEGRDDPFAPLDEAGPYGDVWNVTIWRMDLNVFRFSARAIRCWLYPPASPQCVLPIDLSGLRAGSAVQLPPEEGEPPARPRWVQPSLFFGDDLVKRFKKTADSQIPILEVFERQGWEGPVENPWKDKPGGEKRFGDAVSELNERHVTPNLVRFGRDGFGRAVWQKVGQ